MQTLPLVWKMLEAFLFGFSKNVWKCERARALKHVLQYACTFLCECVCVCGASIFSLTLSLREENVSKGIHHSQTVNLRCVGTAIKGEE